MMKKIIFLLFPFYLFAISNPYQDLDVNEKINIMVNYFLNQTLMQKKPALPKKRELKDDGATLDPVKYELYFSYIQRLKKIRESRAEEQIIIDEEYQGKIGFYNGKLQTLHKFYSKKNNVIPFLQESINKAMKVVYGKPKLSDVSYDEDTNLLKGKLVSTDLYGIALFNPQDVELFVFEDFRKDFLKMYKFYNVNVRFTYDQDILTVKDIIFNLDDQEYVGNFLKKEVTEIKLNIKINDDIFQAVNIGENK